jgi:hypothetical protein
MVVVSAGLGEEGTRQAAVTRRVFLRDIYSEQHGHDGHRVL